MTTQPPSISAPLAPKKIVRKRAIQTALAILAILLLYILATAESIVSFGKTLKRPTADCAIVLGAAVTDEKPSPVFAARIDHAIELYNLGNIQKIIFTGGVGEGDTISEAEAARLYAAEHGIPAGATFAETESRTTTGNLENAQKLIRDNHLASAIVISDPYHLYRASLKAKAIGLEAQYSATPTTRYRSLRNKFKFLMREIYYVTKFQLLGK